MWEDIHFRTGTGKQALFLLQPIRRWYEQCKFGWMQSMVYLLHALMLHHRDSKTAISDIQTLQRLGKWLQTIQTSKKTHGPLTAIHYGHIGRRGWLEICGQCISTNRCVGSSIGIWTHRFVSTIHWSTDILLSHQSMIGWCFHKHKSKDWSVDRVFVLRSKKTKSTEVDSLFLSEFLSSSRSTHSLTTTLLCKTPF